MKATIIWTLIIAFLWVAANIAADYAMTKMENDVIDEKFGQAAGIGFVLIVAIGVVVAKRKGRAQK